MSKLRWIIITLSAIVLATASVPGAASDGINFTIIHTNDEHSALIPHSPAADYDPDQPDSTVGGFARAAGLINRLRSDLSEPTLLISAGDFTAGTAFSWLALDGHAPELDVMINIGYDVIAIGNHEFDYGSDILASYLQAAGYPDPDLPTLLGGNFVIPGDHPLTHAGIQQSTIIDLAGLRVGIFSLLGRDAVMVTADPDPVKFVDQHEMAGQLVSELKAAGAELVIAVTHSGVGEDRELARAVPGIDVIVGGHCHTALDRPAVEGDTIIVQAGAHLSNVGVLQLTYRPASGSIEIRNEDTGHPYLVPVDDRLQPDPAVDELIKDYLELVNTLLARTSGGEHTDVMAIVARLHSPIKRERLSESGIGNLITDAMRAEAARHGYTVDVAIQASGQIRANLIPGDSGLVTTYDLLQVSSLGRGEDNSPGYPLMIVYLTGDELWRAMEISALLSRFLGDSYFLNVSGLDVTWDPAQSIIARVPIKNLPIPSYRAVLSVTTDRGQSIPRGDDTLYAVATDMLLAIFVPQVGDMLPRLAIVPKDSQGNPITDYSTAIVRSGQREVKVWQALVSYVSAQPPGPDGIPVIDERYHQAEGRLREIRTIPLIVWYAGGLLLILLAVVFGLRYVIRRMRRRRLAV